jgi:hypothetical protein
MSGDPGGQINWWLEGAKILANGLVAGLVVFCLNAWRDRRARHRAARALAAKLIDLFERYASDCSDIPHQNAAAQRDGPYDWASLARIPEFPELPEDAAGWQALGGDLDIRARTFATTVKHAREMISGVMENGDADEGQVEIEIHALQRGLDALDLAKRMRRRFGMAAFDPPWPMEAGMKEQLERIRARQARAAASALD